MKAWTYKPLKRNRFFMALIIIFLAFLLNYIPSRIAQALDMPLFLDSIGTLFAAMLGGNLPAVIAGFCGNAANGISNIATLYYGLISVMIGITPAKRGVPVFCMGIAARSEIIIATTSSEGCSCPI